MSVEDTYRLLFLEISLKPTDLKKFILKVLSLEILMKGGLLCVELNKEKNLFSDIWLSGEVNMVFKGVYNKFES